MTDAELNLLEHFAESQDDTITVELIQELRQTRKERDFLVQKYARAYNALMPKKTNATQVLSVVKETTSCQK